MDVNKTTNFTTPSWDLIEALIRAYMNNTLWNIEDEDKHNADLDFYMDDMALPYEWRTALICAFSVNIALSIIGNIGVIVVLFFGRARTVLNRFLINLALADLTMAVFCMPFTFATIMYGHWIFSFGMCPTVIFLQHVSVFVSVYTLTVVGMDRYFAVMQPLTVRVTKNKGKILIGAIWLISILLSIVQAVFARARSFDYAGKTVHFCTEWWPSETAATVHELVIMVISYFLPLSVLLFTYMRIGRKLWGRKLPGNADAQRDKSCANSKKKVVKMLIVVVLMFALCWLPLQVFNLVGKLHPYLVDDPARQDMLRKINACVLWLAMSNSFMNPFIYSFLNDGFRADMKEMFARCVDRRHKSRCQNTSFSHRKRSLFSSTTHCNSSGKSTQQLLQISSQRSQQLIVNKDMDRVIETNCVNKANGDTRSAEKM